MSELEGDDRIDPGTGAERTASRFGFGSWAVSSLLFLGLFVVYRAHDRPSGETDTVGNMLLPLTIFRGEGVYLDRFALVPINEVQRLPYYVARSGRHVVSRYPVGTAFVALPFVAPQILYLDRTEPGWDRTPRVSVVKCELMAKRAAALLAALTAVILHRVLIGLGLGRVAWLAALTAALGSDLWVVGGQSLWQHGPVAFCLSLAIWLLLPRPVHAWRLLLAGLAATALVWCRPVDVPLAVGIAAGVAWTEGRRLAWFLPSPVVGGCALVGVNYWLFGTVTGGQGELERLHSAMHGVSGPWSGGLLAGAAGTLLSPNRGLFVFCPWVFLALLIAPWTLKRLAPWPVVIGALASVVPFGLILAKYAVWWGGHCFGPRYWTDVIPLFAILLAAGLDRALTRSRLLAVLFGLTIAWSVAIQTVGAFCYPSSWNLTPANVDKAHERLWDWRDTEISRCLTETFSKTRPPRRD